jgi:hypothetical protein
VDEREEISAWATRVGQHDAEDGIDCYCSIDGVTASL